MHSYSGRYITKHMPDFLKVTFGFGGSCGLRGGAGLFLRSWNSLREPPTRLPPIFSRIQIWGVQARTIGRQPD
jgi:hypothetical protein